MPHYDPAIHHRRSIRLPDYDYSQPGAYYITIVVHNREMILGEILDGKTNLSGPGKIVDMAWRELAHHYAHLELDEYCIMPNHLHGILVITNPGGLTIPPILGVFKSFTARQINSVRHTSGMPLWQRSFYEHIIRNEAELSRIRKYIQDNPAQWAMDSENPSIIPK